MAYVTIDPDGTLTIREGIPDYATISGLVGGYIEAVTGYAKYADSAARTGRTTAYLNEEGKALGLPANWVATWLILGSFPADIIVGTVVIVGGPSPDGEDTSLTTLEVRDIEERVERYRAGRWA